MIISASRRTDIPAFYTDWLINRFRDGYLYTRNPFNIHQVFKINLDKSVIDCIVFWSKNPLPLLKQLKLIEEYDIKYYFLFTINAYNNDLEISVPHFEEMIETFMSLSERIGKDRVIWRYDPIIFTDKYTYNYHIENFSFIAGKLRKHTNKCIISFVDLYKKCERNLKHINIDHSQLNNIFSFSSELKKISDLNSILLESCAEVVDLNNIGINHGKCVDDKLISKIVGEEISINKDKFQRNECGCVESIDIGEYNTCKHHCLYCYANYSYKTVEKKIHEHDPNSPLLIGHISNKDQIIDRKMISYISGQYKIDL